MLVTLEGIDRLVYHEDQERQVVIFGEEHRAQMIRNHFDRMIEAGELDRAVKFIHMLKYFTFQAKPGTLNHIPFAKYEEQLERLKPGYSDVTLTEEQRKILDVFAIEEEDIIDFGDMNLGSPFVRLSETIQRSFLDRLLSAKSTQRNVVALRGFERVVSVEHHEGILYSIDNPEAFVIAIIDRIKNDQPLEFVGNGIHWGYILTEILTNALIWGNENRLNSLLVIQWRVENYKLVIGIADEGNPFNPIEPKRRLPEGVHYTFGQIRKGLKNARRDRSLLYSDGETIGRKLRSSLDDSELKKGKIVEVRFPLIGSIETESSTEVSSSPVPGGIDFNPNNLDIQVQGERIEFRLPVDSIDLHNIRIDGFTPVIINVTPLINLPLLLGLVDDEEPEDTENVGITPGRDPMDHKMEYYEEIVS